MSSYTCTRCGKVCADKTKYDNHINRKYKCKYKKGLIKKTIGIKCVLCDLEVTTNYMTHLKSECIKSKKKKVKYGYKSKNFAKNIFKGMNTSYADLYILSMKDNDNKCKFNFSKNLYSLVNRGDDMNMYDLKYYLPIKDVGFFLKKIETKNININSVLEKNAESLLCELKDIIMDVNDNKYIINKPVIKYFFHYRCTKCNDIEFNNVIDLYKHIKMYHIKKDIIPDEAIIKNKIVRSNKNDRTCDLCGKVFSSKGNKNKHRLRCKSKINMKDNMDYLIEENSKLQNEVKVIKKLLSKEKEKKNNIINNTTNIMQNNIQININDYGKEDISHIPMEFVRDLITKMNTYSIVKYIEAVHFQNPMNMNIVIPNDLNVVLMKNGNNWAMNNKDYVLNGMIVKNFDRINDIYEKLSPNLPNVIKKNYTQYAECFDTEIPQERERVKENTEKMIINKQKNIVGNQLQNGINPKNITLEN